MIKAVSLVSGGLDSILATRLVQDQGVTVLALHFITPFFGGDKRGREAEVAADFQRLYGIQVRVIDVAEEYLGVLAHPRYGYGKNFNPCIDCKIFLIRKAIEVMHAENAQFLITGEVLGQRPMSQRRDAMNAIARQTGAREILLRPLSAKRLPPTAPERRGWVKRDQLYGFIGRSRKPQMALAARLGITHYETPAGGCKLTDPCLAARVRRYFETTPTEQRRAEDVRLLLVGRPFRFPGGSLLTVGRRERENEAIARLCQGDDEFAKVLGVPGPLGLFRPGRGGDERPLAAAALLRYCPKAGAEGRVRFSPDADTPGLEVTAGPAAEDLLHGWRM